MAKVLTINELYKIVLKAKADGLGKRKVLLSADDEGNEYHALYYGLIPASEIFRGERFDPVAHVDEPLEALQNEYVILG